MASLLQKTQTVLTIFSIIACSHASLAAPAHVNAVAATDQGGVIRIDPLGGLLHPIEPVIIPTNTCDASKPIGIGDCVDL